MLCASRAAECVDVGVGQHVVGRGDHGVEVDGGVAEGGERFEARHPARLAGRRVSATTDACPIAGDGAVDPSTGRPVRRAVRPRRRRLARPSADPRLAPRRSPTARARSAGAVRHQQLVSLLADQEAALAAIGIPAAGDVLTSAQAAALLVEPGERVLVCGGPGVVEARRRGARSPVRATGVARRRDRRLPPRASTTSGCASASAAVVDGARLIGDQRRRHLPDAGRADPGRRGDPRRRRHRVGRRRRRSPASRTRRWPPLVATVLGAGVQRRTAVMVGDRLDTDGAVRRRARLPVRARAHGVTPPGVRRRRRRRDLDRRRPRRRRRRDRGDCASVRTRPCDVRWAAWPRRPRSSS